MLFDDVVVVVISRPRNGRKAAESAKSGSFMFTKEPLLFFYAQLFMLNGFFCVSYKNWKFFSSLWSIYYWCLSSVCNHMGILLFKETSAEVFAENEFAYLDTKAGGAF